MRAENGEDYEVISWKTLVNQSNSLRQLAENLRALADKVEDWHAEGLQIINNEGGSVLLQRGPEEPSDE
jgi:hypothetical protein